MYKSYFRCIALWFFLGIIPTAFAATVGDSLRFVSASEHFLEIKNTENIALDLRYASANNFIGQNLYGEFNRAFLHRLAADKLMRAAVNLRSVCPKCKLLVFDALRPRTVQQILWDKVKGTEQQKYVANPKGGSIHNFGFAVDLSVLDEAGIELDMGTPYDDFTALAQPVLEADFLASGKLTAKQISNRQLLRRVMEDAGFIQLPLEWWHFDALPKKEVKKNYLIVE